MPVHTSSTSAADQPFRFLDLPAELRYMVYENLQVTTERQTVSLTEPVHKCVRPDCITSVTKHLPVAILATCRLTRIEALPFLEPKLTVLRNTEYPYVIVDHSVFHVFLKSIYSLVSIVSERREALVGGLEISVPTQFKLEGQEFPYGTVRYEEIDNFTRKLAKSRASWFLRSTVVAICFRSSTTQAKRNSLLASMDQTNFLRCYLRDEVPGRLRFCDARDLGEDLEEGKE
jgi:hypothetical protein